MPALIDLTGQRFGRLTVVERAGINKHKHVLWRCLCNCDTEIVAVGNNLRKGNTQSCGCLQKDLARKLGRKREVNLVDRRFGRLTVLERVGLTNTGNVRWLCQCDCDTKKVVSGSALQSGNTRSCGCLRLELVRALRAKDIVEYSGAHDRVRALRGPASQYDCLHCRNNLAEDWAYDHLDPDERISSEEKRIGLVYSIDPKFYIPLCKRCHSVFDSR